MSLVMRKPDFCICENEDADQLRGNAKLISAFVFATWIVQSLFYLNPKFQAYTYLMWLYSLVCVRPGRKTRRPVFSQRGSNGRSQVFTHYHVFIFETYLLICLNCSTAQHVYIYSARLGVGLYIKKERKKSQAGLGFTSHVHRAYQNWVCSFHYDVSQLLWLILYSKLQLQNVVHFAQVIGYFVPRSFRTQPFRTILVISYPVTTISYPGHFLPTLVISYPVQLGTK